MSKFTSLLASALALASISSIAFAQQNTISTLPINGLTYPHKAISDAAGNVYVSDTNNNCVKRLTPANVVEVFAGTCVGGYSGDGGAATSAQLNNPYGLVFDSTGNLYIADRVNRRVRKVAPDGTVSTFAGTGSSGYSGDGGAAALAQLADPVGLAIDSSDRLYIADLASQRVRRVENGIISTFAGTGTPGGGGDGGLATAAQLHQPVDVAVDGSGVVYIADRLNASVRRVNLSGVIDTVIGPNNATLNNPDGIAVTASGIVFVPDRYGNRVLVRSLSGAVSVYAGTGAAGYSGDGGPASLAALQQPTGLSVDPAGNLLIGDTYNHRIRRVAAVGTVTNGVCGSASGVFTGTPPTTNLCASGVASAVVTGTGNYTWTCRGTDGGETKSCSAPISTRQITVPASAYPGIQFTNPLATSQVSCSIDATGQWSNGQGSQTTDADGYGANCAQCPETNSPSQRLVMQRGSSWESIGRAKQILLAASETVRFANNDSIGFYGDNSGSMTLDIVCSELASNPSVALTLPRVPILTESIVHGDGHIGGRMDDGVSLGQELRTGETLRIACSGTCIWSASVEPLSASSWLKLTTASNGVAQPSGLSQLAFSVSPFEETQNSRTGSIRVTVNGGASAIWNVTQNPLTDWDEDGVADEWEQRGYPQLSGLRGDIQGYFVDANREVVRVVSPPYGKIIDCGLQCATVTPIQKQNARDLWVWIDEMNIPFARKLSTEALIKVSDAFTSYGTTLRWIRATTDALLPQLPHSVPRKRQPANMTVPDLNMALADLLDLKNQNFTPPSIPARQYMNRVYRYVAWIDRYFDDTRSSDKNADGTDTANGENFSRNGYNLTIVATGGDEQQIDSDDRKAGVLLHETGHSLGLGHGGPQFENRQAAFSRSYWSDFDSDQNAKPNYISSMNYLHLYTGVITSTGNKHQFSDRRWDSIDERNLTTYWSAPLRVNGIPDQQFGVRMVCRAARKVLGADVFSTPTDILEFAAAQPVDCGETQTPSLKRADLSNDKLLGVLETRSDWQHLIFNFSAGFFGAPSLHAITQSLAQDAARPIFNRESGISKTIRPSAFRPTIAIPSINRRVVVSGSNTDLPVKIGNLGFNNDTISVGVRGLAGKPLPNGISATQQTLQVPPGSYTYVVPLLTLDQSVSSGTYSVVVFARSNGGGIVREESVEYQITVVADAQQISPEIVLPIEDRSADNFTFVSSLVALTDTYVDSTPVTLSGFNTPLPIQVRGGEMSINGGEWTSSISSANPGDSLRLRTVSSPFGGDTRTVEVAVGGLVRSFDVTTMTTCGLDVNGDTNISPEIDGLLLTRYMLGFRDDALTNGMTMTGSRTSPGAISSYIGSGAMQYEAFGRTSAIPVATTDGLVLTRLMLGFSDAALLSGVEVPNDAVFTTASEIRTHVNKKCGTNFVSQ